MLASVPEGSRGPESLTVVAKAWHEGLGWEQFVEEEPRNRKQDKVITIPLSYIIPAARLHRLEVPQPPPAALQLGAKCSACVSLWGTLSFKLPHKCYLCFLHFCSSRTLMTFSLLLLGILVVLYGSCSDGLHRLPSLCSSVTVSQLCGLYSPDAQETIVLGT